MTGVKISALEVENVKRVKALALEPAQDGLTVIGGRNGQGKTSVLDAIAWALGGDRRRPSNAKRDGAAGDARLKVVLDNGIVVERKGKNGALRVTDPSGKKGGQALLDSFVGQLALDLPRFMNASASEKAETLLRVIGVGDELAALEAEEDRLYNQRTAIGQMARQKRGAADELPFHADAPAEPVSASELIREQQGILARNGENQRKRERAAELRRDYGSACDRVDALNAELERVMADMERVQAEIGEATAARDAARADMLAAEKSAEDLRDESTAELEASIASIEEVNAKVRENQMRAAAEAEADELEAQYGDMDVQVEHVRARKRALLEGAALPLPGLAVERGELAYGGQPWDCMSGSDQLRVATAVVRATKPECGFVLVDRTEQMDPATLAEFGAWAEEQGLQVICTRVSTGDECSIVIEDGYAVAAGGTGETLDEDAAGQVPERVMAKEPGEAAGQMTADERTADAEAEAAAPTFNFPRKESR